MPTLSLSRSRGGRSRRTTSTAPTMPRKNIKSAIGSKMNLLGGNSPATADNIDIAKSQTKMGSASGTYGMHTSSSGNKHSLTVEDIAKSKAKLERSAHMHGSRKHRSSTTPEQKKYQYVNLLSKRTTSTENHSYDDDEDYTYADGTATMATTALPGEAAMAGIVQSVRDVFKCVMHVADPQCSSAGTAAFNTSGEVGDDNNNKSKKKNSRAPSNDDDDTYGPPTKITFQPTPRSSKTSSKQNQFKRKPLVEDMESLIRVRLRKPLGIIFTSTSKDMKKGVRIYDLPRDGNAYRKAKPSLAVGDQLLSVNGVDMTQRSFESAMNYINTIDTSKHKMDLIFRRASFQTRV